MNGENSKTYYEGQIVSKKDKTIDNDGPVSKKKQKNQRKNQNKTLNQQNMIQDYEKKKQEAIKHEMSPDMKKQKKGRKYYEKIFKNLQSILQNHKAETIWRILEKNDYNQQQALNELLEIPEDLVSDSLMDQFDYSPNKPPDKTEENYSPNQLGTKIIEQMFDTGLKIDKNEFEELFQEIANIIKKDQQERGVTLIEINEFVDDCFSIKKALLLENEDLDLDEDDPLVVQTEQFLEQIIKNKVTEQKKRQHQFPSLGSMNEKKKSKQQKNVIQQIQEGYAQERQKEDYFVPSKIPAQFIEKEKKNNIFALNSYENGYQSSLNIEELSKEYKGISIDKLKFIYTRLEDFNLCKTFLDRYYIEKKVLPQKIQQPKPKVQKQKVNDSNNQKKISMSEKVSKIDPEYKNVPYDDVRDELDHLFKRRQLFRMTRGKIQNTAHRKQLERLACQDDPKIRKLSEISRLKLLEEMIEGHPQDLDLHGYRQEQIDDLFYYIQKMIKQEYKNGNSLIKTKKMGSQVFIMVKAITGKGLHSKYGKSILKPAISSWCERNGLQKAINEQSVDVYFQA